MAIDRADAHLFGSVTRGGKREKPRQGPRPSARARSALITTAYGGAVTHLRAIPGRHGAVGVKGGLESGERLERSVGARAFVDGEDGIAGF